MIGGGYYWYGIPQSPISIKEYIYNYMYVLPEKYLKGSKAATGLNQNVFFCIIRIIQNTWLTQIFDSPLPFGVV